MAYRDNYNYSEDMFADTRMSFGEHIEDLRRHLLRALAGFIVFLFLSLFIGKPVLQYISAPVSDQLEAFYARRAREILLNAEKDQKTVQANRPQWVKMSFFKQQFRATGRGEDPAQEAAALPPAGEMPYADLVARAQLLNTAADSALREEKWQQLGQIAEALQATADAFERVPAADKDKVGTLAQEVAQAAGDLRSAAKREKPEACEAVLQRLHGQLGDRELVKLWVRIEEPVKFFAALHEAQARVNKRPTLSTLSVQEAFLAYFKVSVVCAIVLGSPWIFYQIWLFVAAGLYPHEKRYVHVYLPMSLGLFLFGVVLCQVFVIPKAIEALLWFNEWVGLEPDVRFNEWLGFAIMMPLVFGISFQLPLVMLFLERIGLMDVPKYISMWKISLFLIHVFAAVITPSVDVISMELLALPMFGLYILGIVLCKMKPREAESDLDVPEPEESVEV
jgi:sec-independent protein translocase protein TatC